MVKRKKGDGVAYTGKVAPSYIGGMLDPWSGGTFAADVLKINA
jgi:hypothetical protein